VHFCALCVAKLWQGKSVYLWLSARVC